MTAIVGHVYEIGKRLDPPIDFRTNSLSWLDWLVRPKRMVKDQETQLGVLRQSEVGLLATRGNRLRGGPRSHSF